MLHDGPVREGARAYPQNVNISAAAALAGIGLDRTRLVIVADPGIDMHVVEIEAEGTFGRFQFREEIIPTTDNPKTGRLVAMAVAKTVRQLASPSSSAPDHPSCDRVTLRSDRRRKRA